MDEKEKDLDINEVGAGSDSSNEEALVYEIGFQIIPTITAEEASATFDEIKALLEKKNVEIISEGAPELRDLAYEMSKKIGGKYQKFNKGYFGWVKFQMDRSEAVALQRALETIENILRFIIIKTVRENTLISQRFQGARKTDDAEGDENVEVASSEMAPEAMDQEIDKTLEDLEIK